MFWKKLNAQEEPKSLPSDAFPGLQICQNCFYSAPPDPLAGLKGPTSMERGWERRGGGSCASISQIPGSAPALNPVQRDIHPHRHSQLSDLTVRLNDFFEVYVTKTVTLSHVQTVL